MKKPTPLSSFVPDADEPESSTTASTQSAKKRSGASRRGGRQRASRRTADVRDWLGNVRFSGFMVVALGLIVLAALVLVPTFSNLVEQRQRIAALERQVDVTQAQLDDLKAQRERWRDPAYVTTQARERLYYRYPGEVIYLVVNDLDKLSQPSDAPPPSAELTETRTAWTENLLGSLVNAGLATTVTDAG